MKSSTRRSAALAASIAVASAAVMAALPSTAYATVGATGQIIATSGTTGGITEVTPDGKTVRTLTGSGTQPSWSPTGARVVSVVGNSIVTQRFDGSGLTTVHTTAAATGAPSGPTYAMGGSAIVYTAGNKLQIAPADAAWSPANLLTSNPTGGNCDTQASSSAGSDYLWFTRSGAGCGNSTSVWRYDDRSDSVMSVISDASGAVQAPGTDGRVVYTGSDGQAYLAASDGSDPQALTSDSRQYGSFTWSPDGDTIWAVATSGSTRTQVKIDVSTATPALTTVTGSGRYAAWQPQFTTAVARVYGSSAAATNIAASHWSWAPVGKALPGWPAANSAVLVASGDQVDAALAPALAAKKQGPALMTTATSLDSAVATELQRVLPQGRTVYLVGGTSVLSSAVATKVTALGYKVTRLSGSSRYVTSVDVAKATASTPDYVFLATGGDYHSIMEAESAAGSSGAGSNATAVYTNGTSMTESVWEYLNSLPSSTVLITLGSAETALKSAVNAGHLYNWGDQVHYYPVSGSGNAGTSVALADLWWAGGPYTATFVDNDNWHDGLDGFSAMATWGPVMWVTPSAADSADETFLKNESSSIENVVTFSGTTNVTTNALNGLANSVSASGDWLYTAYPNGYSTDVPTKSKSSLAARLGDRPAAAGTRAVTHGTGAQRHDLGTPETATR